MENIAKIGDNLPPSDAEILKEKLSENHRLPLDHAAKLIADAANLPAEITDEDGAKARADYIKEITASAKTLEGLRTSEKEPYLKLGRVVDGFFKNVTDSLEDTKRKINQPLSAYLTKKEQERRRKAIEEAEAARLKAEEQRLAAEAAKQANQTEAAATMKTEATISEVGAQRLEKIADSKAADLSRTRSSSGAVASLRTWWVGEITSLAAIDLEVLRHHISPEALQKAVNSYVAAGGRELVGAKIYEKTEAVTR